MSPDDNKLYDVHFCKNAKEMWNALEKIYGVFPNIKQEKTNTGGKEDKDITLRCSSKFRRIGSYVGKCITNQYLRINN